MEDNKQAVIGLLLHENTSLRTEIWRSRIRVLIELLCSTAFVLVYATWHMEPQNLDVFYAQRYLPLCVCALNGTSWLTWFTVSLLSTHLMRARLTSEWRLDGLGIAETFVQRISEQNHFLKLGLASYRRREAMVEFITVVQFVVMTLSIGLRFVRWNYSF